MSLLAIITIIMTKFFQYTDDQK